jgi:predicted O-methyltransferase YrrM
MSGKTTFLDEKLYRYMLATWVRETPVETALRQATASMPWSGIESSPEQVQLLQFLVKLTGATRCLEIGVFTGCGTLGLALALPADAYILACDNNTEVTALARQYWEQAGVSSKIDLRIAPALQTLESLLAQGHAGTFDFAYIDADKLNIANYYELALHLVRREGLIAVDNVFWHGRVAEPAGDDRETQAVQALNQKMSHDERVDSIIIPIGDGLALARKR